MECSKSSRVHVFVVLPSEDQVLYEHYGRDRRDFPLKLVRWNIMLLCPGQNSCYNPLSNLDEISNQSTLGPFVHKCGVEY